MSLTPDESAVVVLAGCYVLLKEEESREERRKVCQEKLLKRRDIGHTAETQPSTLSTATSGSGKRFSDPMLENNTEQSETNQKKRKMCDATGSASSREETSAVRGKSKTAEIVVSALHKIASKSKSKDDCDVFGNFVASRLRKLGRDYSEEVEHEIINVIFAAERRKKRDS